MSEKPVRQTAVDAGDGTVGSVYDADEMDAWLSEVIDQALELRDAVDELLDGEKGIGLLAKTAWMLEEPV